MKRPVEDSLSLLIGAGLGVGLMYLLDPDKGDERREHLGRATREKLNAAAAAASSGVDHLRSAAGDGGAGASSFMGRAAQAAREAYERLSTHADELSSKAHDGAADYAHQASDAANGVGANLGNKFDDIRESLSGAAQDARRRYGKWLNRSTLAMGRDEDHHYLSTTACAVGSLALGAGLVYLLDPNHGQERRGKLVSGTTAAMHETGEFFRRVGGHLASQGRSVVASGRRQAESLSSRFSGEEKSEEVEPDVSAVPEERSPLMET